MSLKKKNTKLYNAEIGLHENLPVSHSGTGRLPTVPLVAHSTAGPALWTPVLCRETAQPIFPLTRVMSALHPQGCCRYFTLLCSSVIHHLLVFALQGLLTSWRQADCRVDSFLGPPEGSVNSTCPRRVMELPASRKR